MPASPRRRPVANVPYGIEPKRRKRGGAKPARRPARAAKRGMDVYHLLSAVAGAFMGLVIFSLITPGHVPRAEDEVIASHPNDLRLQDIKGGKKDDGLFHVEGTIYNAREAPCRLASVTIRFFDRSGQVVTKTLATARDIGGNGRKPFSARAHVPGAVRFEVAVDLAHY